VVRGSNPGGGEIFRTRLDRPWGPPSLLYNRYRVSPGGKPAGAWRGVDHPPPSRAEVKKGVELYIYSPFWAFVACSWVNFTVGYKYVCITVKESFVRTTQSALQVLNTLYKTAPRQFNKGNTWMWLGVARFLGANQHDCLPLCKFLVGASRFAAGALHPLAPSCLQT